ncbi:MAG: hypothetical protein JNM93_03330 [Bacteriovoracaceae bacterium]|nr:hypothetical protein [Bacteriovoracaceae bacterium]
MQINKIPFEHGWDWFFTAWHETKTYKKPFLYVGACFFVISQGAKLVPAFGLLFSSFLYCLLYLSLFDFFHHWIKDKNYNQKHFFRFLTDKNLVKSMLPLAYFKMAVSTVAQLCFWAAEYNSRFMLLGLFGFAIEFISSLYILHLAPLMHYNKLSIKPALLITTNAIRKNFLAEILFFSWAITIALSSSLLFLAGWYFTSAMFGYAFYLKHISIYGEVNSTGNNPSEYNYLKASGT